MASNGSEANHRGASSNRSRSTLHTSGLLVLCVAGIYGSYLTQGVLQESLATRKYGLFGHRFPELKALNGVQSAACFLWAFLLLAILQPPALDKKFPPFTVYWKPAVTNSIGPACGFEALKNISYPAQTLAKSSKMIPVMIMGTVLGGKVYSALEYACALLIAGGLCQVAVGELQYLQLDYRNELEVAVVQTNVHNSRRMCITVMPGIAVFSNKSSSQVTRKLASPNAPLGYMLCFANLMLDGYTNAAQDVIQKQYPQTTAIYTMCWMNFWCGLYYIVYLFGFSSSGMNLVRFCSKYPAALYDVGLFCICGAVGQLFIFFTIKTFGALTNTLICTTRKFFNILLSVVWNGNPLLPQQWLAVFMVFSGLLVSSITKARKPQPVVKQD